MTDVLEKVEAGSDQEPDILYIDVLSAVRAGDRQAITEASLHRVYQHVKRAGADASLAILTAFRVEDEAGFPVSEATNRTHNTQLAAELKALRLGHFRLTAVRRRSTDLDADDLRTAPDDVPAEFRETVFAVPGIGRADAQRLATKYHQDRVVYMGPDVGGELVLLSSDGSVSAIGSFTPRTSWDAYSVANAGSSTCVMLELQPSSFMDVLSKQAFESECR